MLTGRERGLDRAASFVMRCVRFVSGGIVPASFGQPTLETQVSDLEFVSPASEGGSYTRGGARRVEIGTLSGQPTFETQAPDLEPALPAFEGEATPEEECEEDVFNVVAQCF